MSNRKYSEEHEWISVDGDIATIGITDHAQEQLGDVVFVEMPEIGSTITKGEDAGVIESVKAASELVAPVSGEVVETNSALEEEPGKVNEDADAAWFIKVKLSDTSELDSLMDADAYKSFIA
jgi:glycine cleavage system H protein